MADYKKYKVGITVKEPWADDITFEQLDYSLWRVEDGGDGCGYIALKDNIGVTPNADTTVWRKATEAGQSIYDLAVKYHHFVGTEEEFEAQYQAALAAANNAAAAASATDAQVQAAEAARVSAEQARATAEAGRVSAESGRVAAENDRVSAETARVSAESARDTAESTRATAETARQSAETARATAEAARASAELSRAQRFGELETDLENSIELSDQAATAAIRAAETVDGFVEAEAARVEAEQGRVSAENERVTAEQGRVSAESARATAETARATAESGRASAETARATAESARVTAEEGRASAETARETQASGDHTRAENDHTAAASDHTRAASDHTQAESDTSRAGTDHTTAASDHTTAASDHTQAGTDHSRAETDHTTAASDHTAAVADHTQAASDHTTAASDHSAAESDHSRAEEDHTRAEADHESIANKADIDGSYDTMSVGMAKNLEGKSIVTESFLERTSGGDAEIANGLGALQGVEGNSQVWNQKVKPITIESSTTMNGVTFTIKTDGKVVVNGTATENAYVMLSLDEKDYVPSGHAVYLKGCPSGGGSTTYRIYLSAVGAGLPSFVDYGDGKVGVATEVRQVNGLFILVTSGATLNNVVFEPNIIDLTLLGINNFTTVAEVEAWLAENIGEQAYYPYEPGTVLNANLEGIESSGFNLLDPATGKAELIGTYSDVYDSYYGITGTHGAITFTDRQGNTETVTPDEEGKFLIEKPGTLTVASAGNDCAVFLWWDGTRTEYEPYEMNVGNLDVKHIYGKLNGEGDYVQVWPTGMPGINGINDTLKIENGEVVARRNIGEVDMGDLTWTFNAASGSIAYNYFSTQRPADLKPGDAARPANAICARYINVSGGNVAKSGYDKTISLSGSSVFVADSGYSDAATFKAAVTGVLLYSELATPQVYTDLIYQGSSLFADGTPVTLPVNYKVNNWGIERIVPKNTSEVTATAKPTLTCRYSIDAVEQLDTMQTEIENLDEKKPNKYGDYPDMAVGSARALAGNNKQLEDFVFTDINAADGIAKLDSVRGKSLVWNQLLTKKTGTITSGGVTYTHNADGSVTLDGECSANAPNDTKVRWDDFECIAGHKYLVNVTSNAIVYDTAFDSGVFPSGVYSYPQIKTAVRSGKPYPKISGRIGYTYNNAKVWVGCIDLTLMFGAGNEPTTVEEFEKLFPLPYYDYNTGSTLNNKTESVIVDGFNQWDEEMEAGGYSTENGAKLGIDGALRSKNMIRVFPSTYYYLQAPRGSSTYIRVFFYDVSGAFISTATYWYGGTRFQTPANCGFITFFLIASYYGSTTYANNICINISDNSRDGDYEPHKRTIIALNLPTLTGKLNGEGESVVVFPDGMRAAGTAYDEAAGSKAVVRFVEIDMGQLDYTVGTYGGYNRTSTSVLPTLAKTTANFILGNSINTYGFIPSDAPLDEANRINLGMAYYNNRLYIRNDAWEGKTGEQVKEEMAGVKLIYELATPLEYTLDTPLPDTFQAYKGGTMRQLPENTSAPTTAPMVMEWTGVLDAVSILTGLPQNYVSKESLQAMLGAMQSAGLFASYTMTFDENTNKYVFTFTANS